MLCILNFFDRYLQIYQVRRCRNTSEAMTQSHGKIWHVTSTWKFFLILKLSQVRSPFLLKNTCKFINYTKHEKAVSITKCEKYLIVGFSLCTQNLAARTHTLVIKSWFGYQQVSSFSRKASFKHNIKCIVSLYSIVPSNRHISELILNVLFDYSEISAIRQH